MNETINQSRWLFIIFPALAMMLGWGLRGHIGGGPFGAMIPGAMVALSLSLLLKLPAVSASVIVVFGVIGIGLGGEMTYGQTPGFAYDHCCSSANGLFQPERPNNTKYFSAFGLVVHCSVFFANRSSSRMIKC